MPPREGNTTRGTDRIWFAQMLRGVAVALVLVEHMFVGFWVTAGVAHPFLHTEPMSASAPDVFYMPWALWLVGHDVILGNIGVALFFLISGFVIPMSLERYSVGRFAVARVFRLYPVWIVSMALVALAFALYAWGTAGSFPYDWAGWWQNTLMVQDWTGGPYINPIVWTLLIELKFYILCGALAVFGLRRATPMLVALGGLVVLTLFAQSLMENRLATGEIATVRAIGVVAHSAPFLCFMFIGVCFYNRFRGRWSVPKFWLVAGACAGMAAWSTLGGIAPDIWQRQVLMGFGIALLVFAGCYVVRARIPYGRAADIAADISYPLYATHYIVGGLLIVALYGLHPAPLLNTVEALVVVVALSWAVHRWVEVPFTAMGKWVRADREALALSWRRLRRAHPVSPPKKTPEAPEATVMTTETT